VPNVKGILDKARRQALENRRIREAQARGMLIVVHDQRELTIAEARP
jgi:hypothetical protein